MVDQNTTRRVEKALLDTIYWNAANVPQTTPAGASDEHEFSDALTRKLDSLFTERPIWSKRAIQSQLPKRFHTALRYNLPKVCYLWANGPWKDGYTKLGEDPRSDPKYRYYQTLTFQLPNKRDYNEEGEADSNWHIFDGRRIHSSTRLLQLCDITDPLMQKLLNEEAVRDEPDVSSEKSILIWRFNMGGTGLLQ